MEAGGTHPSRSASSQALVKPQWRGSTRTTPSTSSTPKGVANEEVRGHPTPYSQQRSPLLDDVRGIARLRRRVTLSRPRARVRECLRPLGDFIGNRFPRVQSSPRPDSNTTVHVARPRFNNLDCGIGRFDAACVSSLARNLQP
jgi:hypothetical protein